ncbi:hypothetical protein V8E54_004363 [Elaphomyces granulatus]
MASASQLVNARIIKVLEPFTLSCVMVVQLDCSPFKEYSEFVRDGRASEFFDLCTTKFREYEYWADEHCEKWNEAQLEAYLQYICYRTYKTEMEAYKNLRDIQGHHQYVCEDAIRVVHMIGDQGVCNRDVKTRSFIVCKDPGTGKWKVFMTDFGLCFFRSQAKSDREFNSWQADEDEEGPAGRGFEYRRSPRSQRLLDEFKREDS